MVVALGTGHGNSHPNRQGGVHPVDDGDVAVLLIVGAAFVVGLGVAVKGGGDELVIGGIGKHVARQLFHRELIERQVAVERPDDPVAVAPYGAGLVVGIPCTVCIAREIQPLPRPVFSVGRCVQ